MAGTHIKGSQVALKCALLFLSATSLQDKTILWQLIWFCRLIQNRHICPFYLYNFNIATLGPASESWKAPEFPREFWENWRWLVSWATARLTEPHVFVTSKLGEREEEGESHNLDQQCCITQAELHSLEWRCFTQAWQPGCQRKEKEQDTSLHK